jgi:hypothetical protein
VIVRVANASSILSENGTHTQGQVLHDTHYTNPLTSQYLFTARLTTPVHTFAHTSSATNHYNALSSSIQRNSLLPTQGAAALAGFRSSAHAGPVNHAVASGSASSITTTIGNFGVGVGHEPLYISSYGNSVAQGATTSYESASFPSGSATTSWPSAPSTPTPNAGQVITHGYKVTPPEILAANFQYVLPRMGNPLWICITCHKSMQEAQRESHYSMHFGHTCLW